MKKKILFVFLCVCLLSSVFARGGGQSQSTGVAGREMVGGNPVLTLTSMYFSAEIPEYAPLSNKMQEITGYKVNINWIPNTAYADKLNTMLASDSLTDIIIPQDLKSTSYINAVDEGLFWVLNDYIKDYPNLVKIGDARYNNVKRNGNIMGIPRGRSLVRQGFIYRQDWAAEEGITEQPKTLADVDKLVRGFAKRPGSRYGLVMGCQATNPAVPEAADYLGVYMGSPLNWGYNKQGEFTHAWLTDEYMQGVEQLRTWYADGFINRNFIEITSEAAKRLLNTEEGGFVFIYTDDIQNRFADLYIKNPNAKLWYGLKLNDRTFGTSGFNASIAISKSSVKDEVMLRHCLSFINNLGVPVWQSLIGVGLEGEHHSIIDGFAVQNEEQGHKWGATANQYGQINCFGGGVIDRAIPIRRIPAIEAIETEQVTYVSSCVMDPTIPFVSPTLTQIGITELDPIRTDAINKYIMGNIDKAAYQAAQQHWLEAGGATVIKEFGDMVKANS